MKAEALMVGGQGWPKEQDAFFSILDVPRAGKLYALAFAGPRLNCVCAIDKIFSALESPLCWLSESLLKSRFRLLNQKLFRKTQGPTLL